MPSGFREFYSGITFVNIESLLNKQTKNSFLSVYLIVLYFKECLTVSKSSSVNHSTFHIPCFFISDFLITTLNKFKDSGTTCSRTCLYSSHSPVLLVSGRQAGSKTQFHVYCRISQWNLAHRLSGCMPVSLFCLGCDWVVWFLA